MTRAFIIASAVCVATVAIAVRAPARDRKPEEVGLAIGFTGARLSGTQPIDGDRRESRREEILQTGGWLQIDLFGYWDKTVYGTLLGGEARVKIGQFARPPRGSKHESNGYAGADVITLETIADFGLVELGPARLVGGVGVGGQVGPFWYGNGRLYPIALGRLDIFPKRLSGLQATYEYLPFTSNAFDVREHRAELTVRAGLVHLGGWYARTTVDVAPTASTFATDTVGLYLGFGFRNVSRREDQ